MTSLIVNIDFAGIAAVRALIHNDSFFAEAGVALSKWFLFGWVKSSAITVRAFDFDWAATTVAYVAGFGCHVLNLLIWV
ncbi:hypothetical protein [Pseudomonas sp. PNPG3]|uniref:hypothetical protein n=1 Tax=Pseudomonas sp. PNPG3 TaxID=2919497 RepID=UPI001FFD0001|nr:hypothetical protein [Pseudomonas sp. PNPG3]MCK2124727.1 hypothetical protein [Pseudomonas sp. PNPG3]